MNRETRIQKIAEIIAREPYGKQDILWHGRLESMNVYEIPLEYLIYNKYNGRILSRTKTLEKQGRDINPETEEGKKIIENLLWKSKESRNEITKKDISDKGQLKIGIITRDGIVIDGNRRLMLLNEIRPKYRHFKAVILPVTSEDDPIEVEKLETPYQMGEDEKLGYNPIENWLDVVKVIDEYLEYLKYDGIYAMADTPNDGKEDLFLYIKKWLDTFADRESNKGFDGYQQMDVDDLKHICFDYVRAKIGKSYDGKIFRNIADGQKKNHFFGDKKIWQGFSEHHFSSVTPAIDKIDAEYPINNASENIEATLSDRGSKFRDEVLDALAENIKEHETDLGYAKATDRPLELVSNARKAIESIDQKHKAFSSPEVVGQIEELIRKLMGMLKKKSPEHTLSVVSELLQTMELNPKSIDKEAMLSKLKDISRMAYQMEKDVKAS